MEINKIIMIFMLAASCKNKQQVKRMSQEQMSNKGMSADTLSNLAAEWKKDTVGCLKLRTKEKANTLIRILGKDVIGANVLFDNFGKPNEYINYDTTIILTYYIQSICSTSGVVRGSDKCYVKFYLNNGVLKQVLFPCE